MPNPEVGWARPDPVLRWKRSGVIADRPGAAARARGPGLAHVPADSAARTGSAGEAARARRTVPREIAALREIGPRKIAVPRGIGQQRGTARGPRCGECRCGGNRWWTCRWASAERCLRRRCSRIRCSRRRCWSRRCWSGCRWPADRCPGRPPRVPPVPAARGGASRWPAPTCRAWRAGRRPGCRPCRRRPVRGAVDRRSRPRWPPREDPCPAVLAPGGNAGAPDCRCGGLAAPVFPPTFAVDGVSLPGVDVDDLSSPQPHRPTLPE